MPDLYNHVGGGGGDGTDSYADKSMLPTAHTRRPPRSSSRIGGCRNKAVAWWHSRSRLGKILYLALVAGLVLALILGLALGLTLGSNGSKEDPDPSTDYVPTTISGSRASLLQQGYWYTAPSNGTNFNWTLADPQLGSYRADSQGVDLVIDTSETFQAVDGFGGAMTDSSAFLLKRLKSRDARLYDRVMDFVFNNATGVGVTRVSMGASDFSVDSEYSYVSQPPAFSQAANELDDPDSLLGGFDVQGTQTGQNTIPVLLDALRRNPNLKVILSPWSPPAFMKSNNTMNGGTLRSGFVDVLAQYYAQTAAAFARAGVTPWAMTLQNEPSHIASYPSTGMDAATQSQLAVALKAALARRGLTSIQVWAHDDNYAGWQTAADIVNLNASAIDAVAFHCYRGDPMQITQFQAALRNGVAKNVHMTECTGTDPPSRWSGIQGWLNNVYWPVSSVDARTVVQWNLALDQGYGPHLESSYCSTCTGSLTLSSHDHPSNPYVQFNDQLYLTSHFSAASTDLTNVAGGQAVRVAANQGSQYSLNRTDWQCLNWVAYAAPLSGTTLTPPSSSNAAPATRRVGLVVANTCAETKNVVVSSDGRRSTLSVQQGLTSFVWTAP